MTQTIQEGNVKESDRKLREFIVTKNLWAVIFKISLPLFLINALSYLYTIIDSIIAADIDSSAISAVAVIGQLTNLIMSLGSGFASGGMILVSRLIGRNDFKNAKTMANTLLFLAAVIGMSVIAVCVPLATSILKIARTSSSLIKVGSQYFMVQIVTVGIMLFNNIFMGLEKARGQTVTILGINIMIMIIKITLSYMFIKIFHQGLVMIAASTLIANLMLTLFVVIRLLMPNYIFRFSFKDKSLKRDYLKPVFVLSFPIFLGRFVFNLGKVIVNAMCSHYGDKAVGALGISNNMGGYVNNVMASVEESSGLIISTNLGYKNKDRAMKAFYYSFILNMVLGILGTVLLTIFNDPIIRFYAKGDMQFASLVDKIFAYEKMGIIALGINQSTLGLLYGYGFTKASMVVNLARLFVFRIPSLAIMINLTNLGAESIGIAMLISNAGIGLMSLVICIIYLKKIKEKNIIDNLKVGETNSE